MKRILIVEDEEMVRELTKSFAEKIGYQVIEAFNGQDGLQKFDQDNNFDLILVDILMPVMDGVKFIIKVRQKYSGPIIVMSAHTGKYTGEDITKAGANYFLPKPFRFENFESAVNSVLDKFK